jgi:hypothetical protein
MDTIIETSPSVRHDVSSVRDIDTAALQPYPPAAFRGPLFETKDKIALVLCTIMMLGPLAALPLGYG